MGWDVDIVRRFCVAGLILCAIGCAAAEAAEPKRVMVLHSFGPISGRGTTIHAFSVPN